MSPMLVAQLPEKTCGRPVSKSIVPGVSVYSVTLPSTSNRPKGERELAYDPTASGAKVGVAPPPKFAAPRSDVCVIVLVPLIGTYPPASGA